MKTNPIIFIDIDGVLKPWKVEEGFYRPAVNVLNRILIETDADLIVSSDWRHGNSLQRLKRIFQSNGIIKEPIAKTATFWGYSTTLFDRAHEIMETVDRLGIENFCVIDDQPIKWTADRNLTYILPQNVKRSDMSAWFHSKFYQVLNEEEGITESDAIQVISMLNSNHILDSSYNK